MAKMPLGAWSLSQALPYIYINATHTKVRFKNVIPKCLFFLTSIQFTEQFRVERLGAYSS